jgi:hypothetical protein
MGGLMTVPRDYTHDGYAAVDFLLAGSSKDLTTEDTEITEKNLKNLRGLCVLCGECFSSSFLYSLPTSKSP